MIIKNLSKANVVSISPLEMIVKNKNNQIRKSIAINEVSIFRRTHQSAIISIKIDNTECISDSYPSFFSDLENIGAEYVS